MRIAFIGDIVGKPGRLMVKKHLEGIRDRYKIDFVIANYENVSHGFGMSKRNCKEIMGYGINAMTGGNHSWDKKEILEMFDSYPIARPVNYPDSSPGKGVLETHILGKRVAIISVMGHYTMPMVDNPFTKIDEIVTELREDGIKHIIVDIHAEATSEKLTMLHIIKDRVSALVGTHTHVGTDDLIIVDGCCYVTDIGLTGCRDHVIGMDKKIPIERFMTGIGKHFDIPKKCQEIFQFVWFELDNEGRATKSEKIKIYSDGKIVSNRGRIENY